MGRRINIPDNQYLKGLKDTTANLQKIVDGMERVGGRALVDTSMYILDQAALNAPVETGTLRGSGYIDIDGNRCVKYDQPIITKEQAEQGATPDPGRVVVNGTVPEDATHAEIGFSEIYAADQHEQIYYDHPRGGQAKYLERVITGEISDNGESTQSRIMRKLTQGIADVLEGRDE